MTPLSISSHMVFRESLFDCLLNLCASRLAVVYASLLSGVRLFIHNLKHLCLFLTFYFSSSFHHAVCFFLVTDLHLNPTVFSMLLFISVFRFLLCFSTSSSSSVVLALFFRAICSSNFFLMVSPFARLCRLTLFFFSAGFSFLMVCPVCITTSRWSECSETDGIALTLHTLL